MNKLLPLLQLSQEKIADILQECCANKRERYLNDISVRIKFPAYRMIEIFNKTLIFAPPTVATAHAQVKTM